MLGMSMSFTSEIEENAEKRELAEFVESEDDEEPCQLAPRTLDHLVTLETCGVIEPSELSRSIDITENESEASISLVLTPVCHRAAVRRQA